MTKTWVIADPHFGHAGVCRFTQADGVTPLRPWDDPDEMTEALINNWNSVIHPDDRVYLLGDVAMNRKALDRSLPRLMGRKVLVKGNHDMDKLSYYSQYFDDIRAYVVKKNLIMSHIPIHPESLSRWKVNIHGHLHSNKVNDPRYVCVSVEHTNYFPVDLQTIIDRIPE
jgi:calcineurin-like phosphoesterase family protein